MKKLSIIIPVFNDTKVKRAIDSIVDSDEIEIIVIDGGSRERTINAINSCGTKVNYFVSEPDRGLYDAMNKGIRIASGEYIMTLAADDQLICNPLAIIGKHMDSNTDLLCGNLVAKDFYNRYFIIKSDKNLKTLEKECSIHHPGVIFKKEVYDQCGGYDLEYRCASDREFFLRCYKGNFVFKIIDELITYFEYGGTSTVNPIRAFNEDIRISDKYNISFIKTRLHFINRVIHFYGSKVKDYLHLNHRTNYMSKEGLLVEIGNNPEVFTDRFN